MTPELSIEIDPIRFDQVDSPWLPGHSPYLYQHQVLKIVSEAMLKKRSLCLFIVTQTGSGKTLASYAYTILNKVRAFGVYPTNELIRDQERALAPWIDLNGNYRLLRVDSQQLDHWQDRMSEKLHAAAFETLLNWRPVILTNPDILFYTFFGLYSGPANVEKHLFDRVFEYPIFIFDEFHLYNVKQMAEVVFLIGTLNTINPNWGRVFIFASATPDLAAVRWLRERLNIQVEVIEATPSERSESRVVAQPLRLTLLPANLEWWKGKEALLEVLPQLQHFVTDFPQARLVSILDSVASAIDTAQILREAFPSKTVGEVHGFTSDEERAQALRQDITVGTSTIEVGIDFKDETEKDVLIFEARTAGQFVQRFGRLARHPKWLAIPNWAIALVPEYVYHAVAHKAGSILNLSRYDLYEWVEDAYQNQQDFASFVSRHAPAEFHVTRQFIKGMFQPDDRPYIENGLDQLIEALTGNTARQAAAKYQRYKEEQILQPLLTFRGGHFEAAILDERGIDRGFPARRYNLMFLLRRGVFCEMSEEEYLSRLDTLSKAWPMEAARERRYSRLIGNASEELLGVFGYFSLTGLLDNGRKLWFEVDEEEVYGHQQEVTVISGLRLVTDPPLRLRNLTRKLEGKFITAWFTDQPPISIKLGRALPPLFEIFELRVLRGSNIASSNQWSIAFNQGAFFLSSLWWRNSNSSEAIIT